MVWQGFEIKRCEQLVGRITFSPDADHVAWVGAIYNLIVVPRPMVLLEQPRTLSTQKIWNVFFINVLQQRLERLPTDNLYFGPRLLVEPPFDDGPRGRESPRRIDNAKLPELFRVVVLRNL